VSTPEHPAETGAGETGELGVDELLDRLEAAMTRLADGSLPLDELVRADEEQWRLVGQIQTRLRDLLARLEAQQREP
jgi:uncharacterized coiled-coil protein SlyX